MARLHTLLPALAVLLLGAAIADARTLLQSSAEVLQGKAVVMDAVFPGARHERFVALRKPDGKKVQLHLADHAQGEKLYTGMRLTASGRWAAPAPKQGGAAAAAAAGAAPSRAFAVGSLDAAPADFAAASTVVLTKETGVAAAGVGGVRAAVVSANKVIKSEVKTLFIPIAGLNDDGSACDGTDLPEFTADQVRQATFAELNPGNVTIGSIYNKCSYGRTKLTMSNSLVADLVKLPCSGNTNGVAWTFSKCDYDDFNGYADAADAVLAERGIDISAFDHHVYLIPPSQCGFVGLGYVGCDGSYECRSWIGADFWTTPAAIAHELGHNLFLAHAGALNQQGMFDEYADLSGIMGYCCSERCPNTAHAWQLGWANLLQLDATTLKPGQTVSLNLASSSASPRSGMRILPNWVAGSQPVYAGYRTKVNGDSATGSNVFGKLHVYTANISGSYDPQVSAWQASLSNGQAWTHPTAGIVVRMALARPGAALMSVCRKGGAETLQSCQANVDRDCNGLVGIKDPACVRILRRARSQPVKRT